MKTKKLLMTILLGLSIAAIVYLLMPNIGQLEAAEFTIGPVNLVVIGVLMLCLLYLKALVHSVILEKYQLDSVSRMDIITSYANGQVVRYIPGKVLGIVSQSLKLGEVARASYVWEANLSQYLITNIVSILLIVSVAAYVVFENVIFILLFFACSLLSTRFLTSKGLTRLFDLASRVLSVPSISTGDHSLSARQALLVMFLLYIEWIMYFAAWYFLVGESVSASFYIGTLYAASSLLALLAFVVPNGLLVREAIFLWLGTMVSIPAEELIFYGLVIRVFYIISDVLFYFLCELFIKITSWSKK